MLVSNVSTLSHAPGTVSPPHTLPAQPTQQLLFFSTVLGLFSFGEIQRVAAVRISDSDKPQIGHVLSSRSSPNERYKDNIILQDVKLRPDSAMNDTHELITDPWLSIQSYKVTYYSDVNN